MYFLSVFRNYGDTAASKFCCFVHQKKKEILLFFVWFFRFSPKKRFTIMVGTQHRWNIPPGIFYFFCLLSWSFWLNMFLVL